MEATLSQKMSQQQILAPRMIQSMEILQMAIMDLQERIHQELHENPVLELKEPRRRRRRFRRTAPRSTTAIPAPRNSSSTSGNNELDFDRLDALEPDWGDTFNEEHRPSRNGIDEERDRKHDAMQNMGSRPQSLQEYLTDQLGFLDLSEEESRLVRHVISHIDENGFLSVIDEADPEYREMLSNRDYRPSRPLRRRLPTFEEMAASFDEPVTPAQVEEALSHVQQLDPPGVGRMTSRSAC